MLNNNPHIKIKKGISPIIGVILLVAVTVALVTLITVIVFGFGSSTNDTADATIQLSETDEELQVQIIRNENVDEFIMESPNGNTKNIGELGSYTTVDITDDGDYIFTAILEDGSKEVLQTKTITTKSDTDSTTGTVSINPPIQNQKVKAIENGNVIDSTTTDENGQYTLSGFNKEKTEIKVTVDGFTHEDIEHPLYASSVRPANDNVDFTFSGESESTINGESILTSFQINEKSTDEKTISTVEELQSIKDSLESNYKLINDIDASETSEWNDGKGFKPIGDWSDENSDREENEFRGSFDGNGYEIEGLYINRPTENNIGLFGWGEESNIKNIGVVDSDLTGDSGVGAVVGNNNGELSKSYSTGVVEGNFAVGGLTGWNDDEGTISNTYSINNVKGGDFAGGLIGGNGGIVSNSYYAGDLTGDDSVNGFVGGRDDGTVENSYADVESSGISSIDAKDLDTIEMQGDNAYDNEFESDIVNNNAFTGVTDDYPVLKWQK